MRTTTERVIVCAAISLIPIFGTAQIGQKADGTIDSLLTELEKGNPISGSVIELGDINFELGEAELTSQSGAYVEKIAQFLILVPTLDAKISGHTDNTGTDAGNERLAKERAESVKGALVEENVARNRLTTEGFGSRRPKVSNATEEGQSQNRRVEIILQKREVDTLNTDQKLIVNEQIIILKTNDEKIGAREVKVGESDIRYLIFSDDIWRTISKSSVKSVEGVRGEPIYKRPTTPVASLQPTTVGEYIDDTYGAWYFLMGSQFLPADEGFYEVQLKGENGNSYYDTLAFEGQTFGRCFNLGMEVGDDDYFVRLGYRWMSGEARMQGFYGGLGLIMGGEKFQFRPALMLSGQYSRIDIGNHEPSLNGSITVNGFTFDETVEMDISNRSFSLIPEATADLRIFEGVFLRATVGLSLPVTGRRIIEMEGNGYDSNFDPAHERILVDTKDLDRFTFNGVDIGGDRLPMWTVSAYFELGFIVWLYD